MDSILKIKAIIFDFDGVILESMDIKTRAFAFLFKDYPNHLQEILKLHKLHGGMSRFEKFDRIYRDILKEPLSQDQKAKLGKDFSNYVYEEILKCPFVEGAFEFLEKYSEKLPLFIVSGTPDEEIKSIIKERNLEKYFKEVLGSPLKKKALNLKILKEYNLNPKDVIFVGDSIDDYEGAKETGIRFVGRIKEANPFEKFKIEATIHNIFDLKKIIPFGKQNSSVLVIFTNDLPKKTQKWWRQFERVVGPKVLREKIKNMHISFTDIEELTNPGSIQEAHRLGDKLSQLALSDGRGLPKLITYLGYEIWWMHYEDLSYKFCLPYTQYRDLLLYLKDFNKIYLYQAPHLNLFQYFFKAYNCEYIIFNQPKGFRFRLRKLLPIPLGILVQVILSLPFLLWLRITRPKLMVWTSDRFDPPHHCDFRMRLIYEELEKRKIPFVEFIRSQESLPTVLDHAWQRKR
ncbi:MAG TPA: HAD family hydrolase, partial [Candidatus Parcubacteria bacterium]|nr:HAD family hydrolase [Candidatus Parcubacteria bacterium]